MITPALIVISFALGVFVATLGNMFLVRRALKPFTPVKPVDLTAINASQVKLEELVAGLKK